MTRTVNELQIFVFHPMCKMFSLVASLRDTYISITLAFKDKFPGQSQRNPKSVTEPNLSSFEPTESWL